MGSHYPRVSLLLLPLIWLQLKRLFFSLFLTRNHNILSAHVARNCRKKLFCNYYKRTGHVIFECKRRPQRKTKQPQRQGQTAFHAAAQPPQDVPSDHVRTMTLTRAQIWEMINTSDASTFTSMGVNDLSFLPTTSTAFDSSIALSTSTTPSTWFLDSEASNHMTSAEQNSQEHQTYAGNETITIINGQHCPFLA